MIRCSSQERGEGKRAHNVLVSLKKKKLKSRWGLYTNSVQTPPKSHQSLSPSESRRLTMSTSPSRPKGPPTKPKKERERERERERKEKALQQSTERLKTVVRRLPPNLPEDVFWQSVQPWVTEESVSWKVFYAGKARKRYVFFLILHSLLQSLILGVENRLSKENIPSRAYIAFKSEEKLAQFSKEYDGHLFRDKAGKGARYRFLLDGGLWKGLCLGNESYAIVEFAPYQKVPTEKRKPDARNATIEKGTQPQFLVARGSC